MQTLHTWDFLSTKHDISAGFDAVRTSYHHCIHSWQYLPSKCSYPLTSATCSLSISWPTEICAATRRQTELSTTSSSNFYCRPYRLHILIHPHPPCKPRALNLGSAACSTSCHGESHFAFQAPDLEHHLLGTACRQRYRSRICRVETTASGQHMASCLCILQLRLRTREVWDVASACHLID